MAMSQPLWKSNNNKIIMMALFVEPILQLRSTNRTFASTIISYKTNPKTVALRREYLHGNGKNSFEVDARKVGKQGGLREAADILHVMDQRGIWLDCSNYGSLLQECVDGKDARKGKVIHAHMIQTGCKPDIFLGTKLVIMYAKCERLMDARRVLNQMPKQNVVSWTAMIAAYVRNGYDEEALKLFYQMQRAGIQPNHFTFASVLPACANLAALEHGKDIHEGVMRNGFQSDGFVGSGHEGVMRNGFQSDGFVGSALVDMYVKCGSIEDARQVFDKMPERDAVSWTAMISGYARNGRFDEALNLFRQMQLIGVTPNSDTFAGVLPACANLAALQQGKEVHENVFRRGFQSDVFVGSALVDMYAKCGNIDDAYRVFDKMSERNVFSWTAIIAGYAMHGYGKEALQVFEQMQQSGTKPNHVTFVGVLCACCHAGLVDDGLKYFKRMSQDYHITPGVQHYGCMVDLLGRAGRLSEARDFIIKMPIEPDTTVWGSLLGACRIHNNVELGEHVAKHLLELDPKNAAHYVQLSNIYAAVGRWDDIEKVRTMMKERKVKKMPGCSWIEVNNKVHAFLVGDQSNPQMQKIYEKLEILSGKMKEAGYVPNTNFVLYDVEEEQKEHILCYHSEKLAVAFGIINMSPGTPIRIVKNLRVCGDCHSAIEFISKIVDREIIVRDANRFHHFKDGWCSCADYW